MARWLDLSDALERISSFLTEFDRILRESPTSELLDRLSRWKSRVVLFLAEHISRREATRFENISLKFDSLSGRSFDRMLEAHRAALIVLAKELQEHPAEVLEPGAYQVQRVPVRRIFLSHAAADKEIAEFFRDRILAARPALEVFLASRPGHIRTGQEWWLTIQHELRTADAYLVLLTPRSLTRPWIPFETGAAWMTGRPLFTVSAGGLEKASIPLPMAFFQVQSLEVVEEAQAVFRDPEIEITDLEGFSYGVARLAASAAERQQTLEGWSGVSVGNRFFAWEGPELHQLRDWPPIPPANGLIEAIRAAGLTPSYGIREKLTKHLAAGRLQVFETDRNSFRRAIVGGGAGEDQILLVRAGLDH